MEDQSETPKLIDKASKTEENLNPVRKQEQWDDKMSLLLQPDVYGYVLDKEVRDTVVALQLLGINTTQSDQGNYSLSPWVQFEAREPRDYYEGERELKASIMNRLGIKSEEIDPTSPTFDRAKQVDVEEEARDTLESAGAPPTQDLREWREQTLVMEGKMQELLDEFYSSGPTPEGFEDIGVKIVYPYRTDDHKKRIHDVPFLQIETIDKQYDIETLPEEDRVQIVLHAQQEMKRFTEFMKQKYFSQ